MADSGLGERPLARFAQLARVFGTFAGATLAACTPPWYRFSTIEVEGRLLPGGRCEAEVRGDVARRLELPTDGLYVEGANLPAPLPPTTLVIECGSLPAADPSRWSFLIAVPDPARGVVPGEYEVVGDDAPPAVRARPSVAAFLATVVPDPANRRYSWRDYRATGGTLTLTAVERLNPGGAARVEGHFRVRARRYVRFG